MASNDIERINKDLEQRVDTMMTGEQVSSAPVLPGKRLIAPVEEETAPLVSEEVPADLTVEQAIAAPRDDLDTPESDAAIDDIVAQEADQVLAAQDAGILADQAVSDQSEPVRTGHPVFWFIIVLFVVVIGIAAYVLTSPGLEITLPF